MSAAQERSHFDCIGWLWRAGLRFGSVIDLGCADGSFSVALSELGPARGATLLNVDAPPAAVPGWRPSDVVAAAGLVELSPAAPGLTTPGRLAATSRKARSIARLEQFLLRVQARRLQQAHGSVA